MEQKVLDSVLSSIKVPIGHPLFYSRLFALVAKIRSQKQKNLLFQAATDDHEELSRRTDRAQIQESVSVRNVLRSRQLAQLLINEKGDINFSLIPPLIVHLNEHLYSLGPNRQHDSRRQEHILRVLQLLLSEKELGRLLKKFTRPLTNKWAEELVRQTLQLPTGSVVTDVHTQQAALAAWLCFLRQNVGSCFATAPAEVIHDEQPESFLQDLLSLVATGTLKRTYEGVENSVPLSATWGSGDLNKPLILRLTSKGLYPEIWFSPSLILAFEAAALLDPADSFKNKAQQIENWINTLIQKGRFGSIWVVTAEELLQRILLQAAELTENQLKEYENRPKGPLQTQMIMLNVGPRGGSLAERCEGYLSRLEAAKNAFKSMADNALLKAWEYTLASFSDIKFEFARWNFYSSLGLQTNEPGGIGQCIYHIIQEKLDQANRNVQEIQYEYEMVYAQVKTLESRMQHTSTEKELEWLKIEYQGRRHEFYFLEERRNAAQQKASSLVDLYEMLYKLYVDLFKDYFQEVYDADMQEVSSGPFDDSPAGFRLLYKHGRSNTSQWTRIHNSHEFIDALASFFVATEPQIAHALDGQQIEDDLSDVVTGIINHVKTNAFLESAFHRMALAHNAPLIKDPLDHIDQIQKKPWVYTSGGTMNTLVSCYYRLHDRPKESEKWIENEMELLVFLADTLKLIPPSLLDPYLKGRREAILMQSPTHAFLLKPLLSPFKEAWMNEEFTYTSIRDRYVRPAEMFVEQLLLDNEMIDYLILRLGEKIPENFQPRFRELFGQMGGPLSPIFFRESICAILEQDRGLRYGSQPVLSADEVDSLLYSALPLFPTNQLRERVEAILLKLPGISTRFFKELMALVDRISQETGEFSIMSAQQLQEICKALLCLGAMRTTMPVDYPLHISLAAQSLGFAMPKPILFADTNWVKDFFGFTVSPGTGKLELWRFDAIGSTGYPMSSWKQWVNGSRPDLKWGVYIKPSEYGQY